MPPGNIAGHKIRFQHLLPVLVKNQVLGRQIYLCIGTAVIRPVMACCCLQIYRFPGDTLSCLQNAQKLSCLL